MGLALELGCRQAFPATVAVRGSVVVKGLSSGDTVVLDADLVPSDRALAARSSDGRSRLFVWASWAAMF